MVDRSVSVLSCPVLVRKPKLAMFFGDRFFVTGLVTDLVTDLSPKFGDRFW